MTQPATRLFVTAVFEAWQQQNISFLVLRNYEGLPEANTSDIDALIAPEHFSRAEEVLLAAARAAGFRLHNRAEFTSVLLQFSSKSGLGNSFPLESPDNGASSARLLRGPANGKEQSLVSSAATLKTGSEAASLQVCFDLFTDMKWRGLDFLSCEDFLEQRIPRGSFAIPHPAHEAATSLLDNLVFHGRVKEKYRAGISAGFRAAPEVARRLLAKTYGPPLAETVVQLAVQERWGDVVALAGALRRQLIVRQALRHPLGILRSLWADAARLTRRLCHPPGLVIVLCGPDGCGKSTVAPLLIEALRTTFSPAKGRQIHWKPRVFSRGHADGAAAATDPHGKPPRVPLLSLAYFLFHWLEFLLGWPVRILPVRFKGGLVLIDRYYYDFFVDQRRYRMNVPHALVRCGFALLPKPDLVFLLDAPTEVLRRRKQEVTPEETARQRDAYRELVDHLQNGVVLGATQPPEKVAADMTKAALDLLAARAAQRSGRRET